ncbi:Cobalt-zinc-cadmium resistance protein CzcC [uncultured bacterium]|nr:Cobalt-zinc-cadmium resistance protein CzcC [uncultured bacterium]
MRGRIALAAAAAALITAFSSPALSLSADRLVLEELLERARKTNPELAALREEAFSAEAIARAEGSLDDPTLKIELEDLSTKRPLEAGPGNAMMTRYTLSQMFPFPGKRSLKEQMANKEAAGARAAISSAELELTAMVKEAYFEYAFIDESIRITKDIKDLLSTAADIAGTMYSTGQVTQQDVIKLNVEQAMLTDELIMLEARREAAAAGIKSLVNMDQSEELGGNAELPKGRVSFDAEELMKGAVESTPDIAMLKADTEGSELGARLADKNYYPDFMVGVAPIQRDGSFDSYDLMFQVNIPIWRGKYESLSEGAKAKARQAHARLKAGKNRKALEVKSASIEVEASLRQMELFETSLVPQAELSYESALRNYRTGRIDLLMLLETERDLRKTRTDYLKALFEYNRRLANLERASGVELSTAQKE